MASSTKVSAVEHLARGMFVAEHGHTGLRWEQLDEDFGQEDWRRKARRLLEGMWDPKQPFVIIDQENDVLYVSATEPDPHV